MAACRGHGWYEGCRTYDFGVILQNAVCGGKDQPQVNLEGQRTSEEWETREIITFRLKLSTCKALGTDKQTGTENDYVMKHWGAKPDTPGLILRDSW